jgi:ABC-type antimicrobial peptide transport system permease subunit
MHFRYGLRSLRREPLFAITTLLTPEFAVRSAVGGGARTLASQLIAEGASIALPGCAFGLALAYAATRAWSVRA